MPMNWLTKEQRKKAATRPGAPLSTTWLECILPSCEMSLNVTPPEVDLSKAASISQAMGAPLDFFPQQAVLQHAQRVEAACEKHLATHTVQEWAPALSKAQVEVGRLMLELESQRDLVMAKNELIDTLKEQCTCRTTR